MYNVKYKYNHKYIASDVENTHVYSNENLASWRQLVEQIKRVGLVVPQLVGTVAELQSLFIYKYKYKYKKKYKYKYKKKYKHKYRREILNC